MQVSSSRSGTPSPHREGVSELNGAIRPTPLGFPPFLFSFCIFRYSVVVVCGSLAAS